MDFSVMFKFFPLLMLTPWVLYFTGAVLGATFFWEKGRRERFIISMCFIFVATLILSIIIWPGSIRAMAELIKSNYYFPEK